MESGQLNWGELQSEHKVWLAREFPNQPPLVPAVGMLEEAGELMHALLKLKQLDIWGEDARYNRHLLHAALADAIGDCAIYALSMCNAAGYNFSMLVNHVDGACFRCKTVEESLALMAEAAVNNMRKPSQGFLILYLSTLQHATAQMGFCFEECVNLTWAKVRQRTRKYSWSGRIGNETDFLVFRKGSGPSVEITDIAVNSDRRKGIGRAMVNRLIAQSPPECRRIYAIARDENDIATHFYGALGFEYTELSEFYPDGDARLWQRDA